MPGTPAVGVPATAPPAPTPTPSAQHATSYLPVSPANPTGDPLIGQTIGGRYHIVRKLGEGGMGAVYLATHQLLEKQVALKVLHGEFARKPDLVERFMQEAKSASRIRHENVIDISDFGSTPEGLVFFAMELLKGHDLHEEIARARLAGQLLPWARSKKIFLQICAALTAAHGHGIVHRDLKPENVYLVEFLGEPDFVKLLDFGIAKLTELGEGERKLTRTGMLFGTPEYMSPEQARGENVDHRVDVYAMGCILFQLITGRVPFEADNFMGVLTLHLTEPPPVVAAETLDRIGAPRELAAIIDRALAKNRDERFGTILDLANAVRAACGDPIASGETGLAIPAQRPASVPAPATTHTRQPTPAPGARSRTQWTGNLAIPTDDEPGTAPRSKLPLVLGAVVLAAGAAAAAVYATRGGDEPAAGPVGEASGTPGPGSQVAAAPPDARAEAAPEPPPDPPPAALPDVAKITIETQPPGATVTDLLTNAKHPAKTPAVIKLRDRARRASSR